MALDVSFDHPLRSFGASVDLSVDPGETFALVGPSGAGKTTVLRVVAGLLRPRLGRVALARALAREPSVLLLDEPMAALDAHTRGGVRAELQELLRELALPTILVTHDFEDAAALADRVGVIAHGRILQLGPPDELVAA